MFSQNHLPTLFSTPCTTPPHNTAITTPSLTAATQFLYRSYIGNIRTI